MPCRVMLPCSDCPGSPVPFYNGVPGSWNGAPFSAEVGKASLGPWIGLPFVGGTQVIFDIMLSFSACSQSMVSFNIGASGPRRLQNYMFRQRQQATR